MELFEKTLLSVLLISYASTMVTALYDEPARMLQEFYETLDNSISKIGQYYVSKKNYFCLSCGE